MGGKRPFKVTPKGGGTKTPVKLVLPTLLVVSLLLAATVVGFIKLQASTNFWYRVAVAINLFWALWLLTGYGIGLFLIFGGEAPPRVRRTWRQKYTPELLEVSPLIYYAVELESAIAQYDERLAARFRPDDPRGQPIRESARESVEHAMIYARIASAVRAASWSFYSPVLRSFLETIKNRVSKMESRCLSGDADLDPSCLLIEEELMMRVVAQLIKEVLSESLTEDMIEELDRIADDEVEHFYAKLHVMYAIWGERLPVAVEASAQAVKGQGRR